MMKIGCIALPAGPRKSMACRAISSDPHKSATLRRRNVVVDAIG